MSLGWVVMEPDGDRPLILQKAGGLQGMFVYSAFAPTRGVGVFVAINQFDFAAADVKVTLWRVVVSPGGSHNGLDSNECMSVELEH